MPARRKSQSPRRPSKSPRRRSLTGKGRNVIFRGAGDEYVGETFQIFFDFGGWKDGFTGTQVGIDPFWGHQAVFFEHGHPDIQNPIAIPLAWIHSKVRRQS